MLQQLLAEQAAQEGQVQSQGQPVAAQVAQPTQAVGTQISPMTNPFLSPQRKERVLSNTWMDHVVDDPISSAKGTPDEESVRSLSDEEIAQRLEFFANPSSNPQWMEEMKKDSVGFDRARNASIEEAARRANEKTGEQKDPNDFWKEYNGQYDTEPMGKKEQDKRKLDTYSAKMKEQGSSDEEVGNLESMWNELKKAKTGVDLIPHALINGLTGVVEQGHDLYLHGVSLIAGFTPRETLTYKAVMMGGATDKFMETGDRKDLQADKYDRFRASLTEYMNQENERVGALPTKTFIASAKKDDFVGSLVAGFGGTMGLVPSAIVGVGTMGWGMEPYMAGMAEADKVTNSRLATGKEIADAYRDGDNDQLMSWTTSMIVGFTEKLGLKKLGKSIEEAFSSKTLKDKAIRFLSDSGIQGATETFQGGIEHVGTAYNEIKLANPEMSDAEAMARAVKEGALWYGSGEAFETFATTALGVSYMTGASHVAGKAWRKATETQEQKLAAKLDDPNVSEASKTILRDKFNQLRQQASAEYQQERTIFKSLSQEEQTELGSLAKTIKVQEEILAEQDLDDDAKQIAEQRIGETLARIDAIKAPIKEQLLEKDKEKLRSMGVYTVPMVDGVLDPTAKTQLHTEEEQKIAAKAIDEIVQTGIKEKLPAKQIAANIEAAGHMVGDGILFTTQEYVEMATTKALPSLTEAFDGKVTAKEVSNTDTTTTTESTSESTDDTLKPFTELDARNDELNTYFDERKRIDEIYESDWDGLSEDEADEHRNALIANEEQRDILFEKYASPKEKKEYERLVAKEKSTFENLKNRVGLGETRYQRYRKANNYKESVMDRLYDMTPARATSTESTTEATPTATEPVAVTPTPTEKELRDNIVIADIEKRRKEALAANVKLTELTGGAIGGEKDFADQLNAKFDAEIDAVTSSQSTSKADEVMAAAKAAIEREREVDDLPFGASGNDVFESDKGNKEGDKKGDTVSESNKESEATPTASEDSKAKSESKSESNKKAEPVVKKKAPAKKVSKPKAPAKPKAAKKPKTTKKPTTKQKEAAPTVTEEVAPVTELPTDPEARKAAIIARKAEIFKSIKDRWLPDKENQTFNIIAAGPEENLAEMKKDVDAIIELAKLSIEEMGMTLQEFVDEMVVAFGKKLPNITQLATDVYNSVSLGSDTVRNEVDVLIDEFLNAEPTIETESGQVLPVGENPEQRTLRSSILAIADRAMLAGGEWLREKDFQKIGSKGRMRYFFDNPKAYIVMNALDGYSRNLKGYSFMKTLLTKDEAMNIMQNFVEEIDKMEERTGFKLDGKKIKEPNYGDVNTVVQGFFKEFEAAWKDKDPESYAIFDKYSKLIAGIPSIKPSYAMAGPNEWSDLGLKRLVTGLFSEDGMLLNPDVITQTIQGIAASVPRGGGNKGFIAAMRKVAYGAEGEQQVIAMRMLDRIGALVDLDSAQINNSGELKAIFNTLANMGTDQIVVSVFGSDGMVRREIMNVAISAKELVSNLVGKLDTYLTQARAVSAFNSLIREYKNISKEVTHQIANQGALTPEQDIDYAKRLLNLYHERIIKPYGGLYNVDNSYVDGVVKSLSMKNSTKPVWVQAAGMIQVLDNSNVRDKLSNGKVVDVLSESSSYFNLISQSIVNRQANATTWRNADGENVTAQGPKDHVTLVTDSMLIPTEEGGTTPAQKMLKLPFYKNNPILKFWNKGTTTGRQLWTEGNFKKQFSIELDKMGSSGVLADNLMAFFDNTKESYKHMYMLNGDRMRRYVFDAPLLSFQEIGDHFGLTNGKFDPTTAIVKQFEQRAANALAGGDVQLNAEGLDRLNSTYHIKFKIENGKFVADGELTNSARQANINALTEKFRELNKHPVQYEGMQLRYMDAVLAMAAKNPKLAELLNPNQAYDSRLRKLAALYEGNNSINELALSDVLVGDLINLRPGAKGMKDAKSQSTGGMNVSATVGPFYIVTLKEFPGMDSGSFMNAHMSEAAGQGVINGLGPNIKIGFFGVVRNGLKTGHGLAYKMATMNAVRGKDGKNKMEYDHGDSDQYAKLARLMDRIEAEITAKNTSDVKPRILFMPPTSQKVQPYKTTPIDLSTYNDDFVLNESHFQKVTPETHTVNFNINNDMTDGARSKSQLVQMLSIIQEAVDGQDLAIREAFLNKFHSKMVDVMKEQMKEGFNTDPDVLAKQLIEQVFGNDMSFSSKAALQHLKNLFEDPNITHHIEDENLFGTALGKLTQTFNRVAMTMQLDGGTLQTFPDLETDPNKRLKWKDANGTALINPEVAVPPSMGAIGDLIILARVPSSGSESMFVGRIVGHLPANVNGVKVPFEYLLNSNSDHDGDMLHAFIEKQSKAAKKAFVDFMMSTEAMLSPTFLQRRDKPLTLDLLDNALNRAGLPKVKVSLNSVMGRMNILDQMNSSSSAIGIFANAKKVFTNLAASGKSTVEPTQVLINGKVENAKAYSTKNLPMMGELLQAALDKFDNLMLSRMGIDMANINEIALLANLETRNNEVMSYDDIITLLQSPEMKAYVKGVNDLISPFEGKDTAWPKDKTNILDLLMSNSQNNGLNKEILGLIRLAVVEGNQLNAVASMTSLDKGMQYGMGQVLHVLDMYNALEAGKTGYLQLFKNALGKHHHEVLELFVNTMKQMSLSFGNDAVRGAQDIWDALGIYDRKAKHWEKLATIGNKMLNATVTIKKYDNPDAFVQSFGEFLYGLKNGSDTMYPINSTSDTEIDQIANLQAMQEFANNAREQLLANKTSPKSNPLSNTAKQKYLAQISDYVIAKNMVSTLTNNVFIRNLTVIKDRNTGKVIVNLSRNARQLNGVDKAALLAAYEKLPQQFRDSLHDFALLNTGSKITPSSLWSLLPNSSVERYNAATKLINDQKEGAASTPTTAKNNAEFSEALMMESMDMLGAVRVPQGKVFSDIFRTVATGLTQDQKNGLVGKLKSYFPNSAEQILAANGEVFEITHPATTIGAMTNGKMSYRGTPMLRVANANGIGSRYFLLAKSDGTLTKDNGLFTMGIAQTYVEITAGIEALQKTNPQGYTMDGDRRETKNADAIADEMRKLFEDRFKDVNEDIKEGVRMETANHMGTMNAPASATRTIASDPKLYDKIVKRLKEKFPEVQVMDWDAYQKEFGAAPGVGQARQFGLPNAMQRIVAWSMSEGELETPPHEYAHQYVWMFKSHPLIQKGIELYGSAEALVDAVGKDYVRQIESEGTIYGAFSNTIAGMRGYAEKQAAKKGYAQSFWKLMRSIFGSNDIAQVLAKNMLDGTRLDAEPTLNEQVGNMVGRRPLPSNANQFMDSNVIPHKVQRSDADLDASESAMTEAGKNIVQNLIDNDIAKERLRRNSGTGFLFQVVQNFPGLDPSTQWSAHNFALNISSWLNNEIYTPAEVKEKGGYFASTVLSDESLQTDPLFMAHSFKQVMSDLLYLKGEFDRTAGTTHAVQQVTAAKRINGLMALMYNSSDPLDASSLGFQNALSAMEVAEVRQAYDAIMRTHAMLQYQKIASKQLNIAEGEVAETSKVLTTINDSITAKSAVLKRIWLAMQHDEGFVGKATDTFKGIYSWYQDKFDRLDVKVFAITGDESAPLYQVLVQSLKTAQNRYNRIYHGTSIDKGVAYIWSDAIGKLKGLDAITYNTWDQGTVWKLKDATPIEVMQVREVNGVNVLQPITVSMSVGEKLWVSIMAKQVDAKTGISFRDVLKNGGMGFSTQRHKKDVVTAKYKLTEAQIVAIENEVAAYQGGKLLSQVMPAIANVFAKMQPAINQTYKELTGLDLLTDPDYFPKKMHGKGSGNSNHVTGQWDRVISPLGIIGTSVTLEVQDVFSMMHDYTIKGAEFHAYAIPIRNAGKLLSGKDAEGYKLEDSLMKVGLKDHLDDVVKHIEGMINTKKQLGYEGGKLNVQNELKPAHWLSHKLHSRLTVHALGHNLVVTATQLLGGPMATQRIPWKYLQSDTIRVDKTIFSLLETLNREKIFTLDSVFDYANTNMPEYHEMRAHSSDLNARLTTRVIDSSQESSMQSVNGGKEDKLLWLVNPSYFLAAITWADLQGLRIIWNGAKNMAADPDLNLGLVVGSTEYWEHVAAVAEDVVRETQSSFDKVNRTRAQANPGHNFYSYFQRFSSQSVAISAQLKKAHYQSVHNPTPANRAHEKRSMAAYVLINSTGYVAVRLIEMFMMYAISMQLNKTASIDIPEAEDPLMPDWMKQVIMTVGDIIGVSFGVFPIGGDLVKASTKSLSNYAITHSPKEAASTFGKSVFNPVDHPIIDAPVHVYDGVMALNDGDVDKGLASFFKSGVTGSGFPSSYFRTPEKYIEISKPTQYHK